MNLRHRLAGRTGFLLLAVGSIGLVGTGLFIQELDHLQPCPLCIFQRLLYLQIAA
ncbi:MAG: disulfide bond formation protein B, partial [Betaproteobacteria bacterium]|nr:disulfide bond formation protein B [Betaproteobacteria bacterium]